jgi:hypothetical protein
MSDFDDNVKAYKEDLEKAREAVFPGVGKSCPLSKIYEDTLYICDHMGVDTVIPVNNPRRGVYGAPFLNHIKSSEAAAGMNKFLTYNKVWWGRVMVVKDIKSGTYLNIDNDSGHMFLSPQFVGYFYPRALILGEKFSKLTRDKVDMRLDDVNQELGNYPLSVATGGREKDEIPDYRYIYKKRYNEEWA